MSDWTSGYVADIGYTYGYYSELNPLRVKLAFLNAGLKAPEFGTACELGFGQGLSVNVHAAASVTSWYGTDFNPTQADFAQEISNISGADTKLYDDSFIDFCRRTELPEFDYIGLHGIWSWISDENRSVIVDFVRRKLKVGGVLYISYNTLPGWSAFAPIRHLMSEHAQIIGTDGQGMVSRVNGALDFTEQLLATNPIYALANPQIAARFNMLKDQDRHYLAHEYFNRDWHPMHFATVAKWLSPAKVNYACSAHYFDHVDGINLTAEQGEFLRAIPDRIFLESVRDYMVNQQFRRDYWIKGGRKLSILDQAESQRILRVILITPRSDVSLKITGALGEASMSEEIYSSILDLLSEHIPKTLGQIEQAVKDKGVSFAQVMESMLVLTGGGHLAVVQNEEIVDNAKKRTDKLNMHILNKARGSNDFNYLASPITGGGVTVGRFQQLFLLAMSQGKSQPAEWAQYVWQVFDAQGQKIVKEGKTLETAEANLAELIVQAKIFAEKQLPILKALQIG